MTDANDSDNDLRLHLTAVGVIAAGDRVRE
jgi:hypothetical protein